MTNRLIRKMRYGQRDPLEGSQQSLRRGTCRLSLGVAGVQAPQRLSGSLQ